MICGLAMACMTAEEDAIICTGYCVLRDISTVRISLQRRNISKIVWSVQLLVRFRVEPERSFIMYFSEMENSSKYKNCADQMISTVF